MPTMRTIRQVAASGLMSEHYLRMRLKQGRLPGIYAGSRFLINVDLLSEMLDVEAREALQPEEAP